MPVFDAGQRVKVGFLLGPFEAPFVFFLLPYLCVDIDDTDDQTRPFLFLDNGSPKLYITRRPSQHEAIADRENAVSVYFLHHIFFCQHFKEAVLVLRIDHLTHLLPGIDKEIRSLPGAGKILKAACRAVFVIMSGLRDDRIETQEVAGECPEPCVGNLLLLHTLHREALLHFFINIRDSDDDEALIVLHAGNLHSDESRPMIRNQAVLHHKGIIMLQRCQKRFPVHRFRELGTVLGIYKLIDLNLAFLKEVPAAPGLGQCIEFIVCPVFDKLLCLQIHIVQIRVAARQRLCNVRIDDPGSPGFFIRLPGRGDLAPDAYHVRHILTDPKHALAAGSICVLELGRLKLVLVPLRVRNVLHEDVGRIHRQSNPVFLVKLGCGFRIKDFRSGMTDHAVRTLLVGILRKTLVACQVHERFGIFGKIHSGHVVEKRGDRLFQFRDLLRFFKKQLLFIRRTLSPELLQQKHNNDREYRGKENEHKDPVIFQEAYE